MHLRPARNKARTAATAEALQLLGDLGVSALNGGPLSEQGSLFWISIPPAHISEAKRRLPRLGYTYAVDLVRLAETAEDSPPEERRLVRWRRKTYELVRVYEENAEAMREMAPDRRSFLIQIGDEVREIQGYRGDGAPLSRRGLPVYDARLLVNLVRAQAGARFLDPFAGIGGIVIEALASDYEVSSSDIDPILQPGLAALGATHQVADAAALPFATASIDIIATELPFHESIHGMLAAALREMDRVLRPGGRVSVCGVPDQAPLLRAAAAALEWQAYVDTPINRKGLDVVVIAWKKPPAAA